MGPQTVSKACLPRGLVGTPVVPTLMSLCTPKRGLHCSPRAECFLLLKDVSERPSLAPSHIAALKTLEDQAAKSHSMRKAEPWDCSEIMAGLPRSLASSQERLHSDTGQEMPCFSRGSWQRAGHSACGEQHHVSARSAGGKQSGSKAGSGHSHSRRS